MSAWDDLGATELLTKIARERGFEYVDELNDARATTHADALNLLDTAIERAQA